VPESRERPHTAASASSPRGGETDREIREAGFDSAPIAHLAVDLELRLALANREARTLFGLTEDDIGKPFRDLDVSMRPLELPSRIERALRARSAISLREIEWRLGDDVRFLDVQVAPLVGTNGDLVGAGITFIDVTRYRRLQEALQRSKRNVGDGVDAREHARSEFVANAAHELLTPLTGIVSAAHVLEAGAKEVPEIRDRFLLHISRECNRLTRLARSLLTLARAQSGEEPPHLDSVRLRDLLETVVEGVAELGSARIDCSDDVTVFVDPDLAETALANLVANAFRHSPNGGVAISVDTAVDERRVGIVVASSATVADSDVDRMQRRFVSGAGRDGGGFGLGVSIATQALEALDGSLAFESDRSGTRARVDLPIGWS
jgi:PAS domain S-box-containing protein